MLRHFKLASLFSAVLALLWLVSACDSSKAKVAASAATSTSSSSGTGTPPPPPFTVNTFQPAAVAIGQLDLVSGTYTPPSPTNLGGLYGDATANGTVLYVPDYGNSRVLGFNTIPTASGAAADFVLGQASFATNGGGTSSTAMSAPQTVQADQGRLLVDEYGNSRILVYNTAPTATGAAADLAVGQPDLISSGGACLATRLAFPESFRVANGKLIVGDSGNNRVLIWNTVPTAFGTAPDVVLGQSTLTNCWANDSTQTGTSGPPTARTLNYPTGVWTDGTRLVVTDSSNNRVLIWNTFPTANFAAADLVLGQGDFAHITGNDDGQTGIPGASTARTLSYPYFLDSDGTGLFVTDSTNSRVLIWSTFPTANFAPADKVLGQSDFAHSTSNDDNQDSAPDAAPSARTLAFPHGVRIIGNQLFVADAYNLRVLIYQGQ
jgi:hypothetical protein